MKKNKISLFIAIAFIIFVIALFTVKIIHKVDNTNENDLVFDPCAGSFTTGIACKQLKRNCIGIELNTDYYKKALFRLNSYK